METPEVIFFGQTAIDLILWLSLPAIAAATGIGLLIAILQAALQLQEQTLAFLCKLLAIVFTFTLTSSWFGAHLVGFMDSMLDQFPMITR